MKNKLKIILTIAITIYFSFIYDLKSYSQYFSFSGLLFTTAEPFFPDARYTSSESEDNPYLTLSWPFHFVVYEFNYNTFSTVLFEPQYSPRNKNNSFLAGTRLWYNFDEGTILLEGGGFISENKEKGGFAGIGAGLGEHYALVFRGYKSDKEKKFDASLDIFFIIR